MKSSKVKQLVGLIMSSANPERLASFYINVLGLPFILNKHGNAPEHWECDFEGIHYAILKDQKNDVAAGNIIPSFEVEDINEFVKRNDLSMLHPLMNLGNGDFIGSIADVDGNIVRLWMTGRQNPA